MKKLILIAAVAALSACSEPASAPEAEASAEPVAATEAVTANIAADGKPSAGKYRITRKDGKVYTEEDKPDGTYVSMENGKVVETGKWTQPNPNTFCTTKDAKDAKEECNEEKIENGVWTSKNAKGEVSTIERVEG